MNEMIEQLKIDPEFEKVIPPLTKDGRCSSYVRLQCNGGRLAAGAHQ